jgi:pilus assembly protein FimV
LKRNYYKKGDSLDRETVEPDGYVDITELFSSDSPGNYQQDDADSDLDSILTYEDIESPIKKLKAHVLSLDWEITDEALKKLDDEITILNEEWKEERTLLVFLQMLRSLGDYVGTYKAKAHVDSIKLLYSVYNHLEEIVLSSKMTEEKKIEIANIEINKFKKFKLSVASQTKDEENAKKTITLEDSAIKDLKAIVLSLEWEITDEIIANFHREASKLEEEWKSRKLYLILLKILLVLGDYLGEKKSSAHPDAVKLLMSVFDVLEIIVLAPGMEINEQKKIVSGQVQKFKDFKILLNRQGAEAGTQSSVVEKKSSESSVPDLTSSPEAEEPESPEPDLMVESAAEDLEPDLAVIPETEEPESSESDLVVESAPEDLEPDLTVIPEAEEPESSESDLVVESAAEDLEPDLAVIPEAEEFGGPEPDLIITPEAEESAEKDITFIDEYKDDDIDSDSVDQGKDDLTFKIEDSAVQNLDSETEFDVAEVSLEDEEKTSTKPEKNIEVAGSRVDEGYYSTEIDNRLNEFFDEPDSSDDSELVKSQEKTDSEDELAVTAYVLGDEFEKDEPGEEFIESPVEITESEDELLIKPFIDEEEGPEVEQGDDNINDLPEEAQELSLNKKTEQEDEPQPITQVHDGELEEDVITPYQIEDEFFDENDLPDEDESDNQIILLQLEKLEENVKKLSTGAADIDVTGFCNIIDAVIESCSDVKLHIWLKLIRSIAIFLFSENNELHPDFSRLLEMVYSDFVIELENRNNDKEDLNHQVLLNHLTNYLGFQDRIILEKLDEELDGEIKEKDESENFDDSLDSEELEEEKSWAWNKIKKILFKKIF